MEKNFKRAKNLLKKFSFFFNKLLKNYKDIPKVSLIFEKVVHII